MRIPTRFAPQLFALFMSFVMAFFMTAFMTWYTTGLDSGYLARWAGSFIIAWPIALVLVALFAGPIRLLVGRLTAQ